MGTRTLHTLIRNGVILAACAVWAAPAYGSTTLTAVAVQPAPIDPAPVRGTTWYVRTSGSDYNPGTSAASAFKTIGKAENMVTAGDTVYVGAGTYAETISTGRSGTAGAYISFIGDTNGARTGDAGDVVVDGTNSRDRGFDLKDDSYLRISGFHVIRTKKEGIRTEKSYGVIVDNCRIYQNQDIGVKLREPRGGQVYDCHIYANGKEGIKLDNFKVNGVTITRCMIYQNGEEGLWVKGDSSSTPSSITNCMCHSNTKDGIQIEGRGTKVSVYNNTLVDNQERGVEIKDGTVTLVNNIMAFNKDYGVKNDGDTSSNYNLFWGNKESLGEEWVYQCDKLSCGPDDAMGDPLFKDRVGKDYNLATNSPAVNAGAASGAPTVDYGNQTRRTGDGFVDIGADECGTTLRVTSWREVQR